MGKNINFSLQFSGSMKNDDNSFGDKSVDDIINVKARQEKMEVKIEDYDNNMILLWTPEKFREKLIMMRDYYETHGETGLTPEME